MRYYNGVSGQIERVRPRKMPNPTGRQREKLKLRSLCRSLPRDQYAVSPAGGIVSLKRVAFRARVGAGTSWVSRLALRNRQREWLEKLRRSMRGN